MALAFNPFTGNFDYAGGAKSLEDLTDVVITDPVEDQALVYNGTNWVNGAGGGSSAAGNLFLASQFT